MKISITEFRDMVAAAVRSTVAEAKRKPKDVAPRSEESILAQRDAQVRGLPGYSHGNVLDMSKPLGKRNRAKRQGAAGIGGWTSEGLRIREAGSDNPGGGVGTGDNDPGDELPGKTDQTSGSGGSDPAPVSRLIDIMLSNGIPFDKAQKIARQMQSSDMAGDGLDDPSQIGLESRNEAVRRLVRMIVREEIRVRR